MRSSVTPNTPRRSAAAAAASRSPRSICTAIDTAASWTTTKCRSLTRASRLAAQQRLLGSVNLRDGLVAGVVRGEAPEAREPPRQVWAEPRYRCGENQQDRPQVERAFSVGG